MTGRRRDVLRFEAGESEADRRARMESMGYGERDIEAVEAMLEALRKMRSEMTTTATTTTAPPPGPLTSPRLAKAFEGLGLHVPPRWLECLLEADAFVSWCDSPPGDEDLVHLEEVCVQLTKEARAGGSQRDALLALSDLVAGLAASEVGRADPDTCPDPRAVVYVGARQAFARLRHALDPSRGRCRAAGCGREIVWVKTRSGEDMPLDPPVLRIMPMKLADEMGIVGPKRTVITEDGRCVIGRVADINDRRGGIVAGRESHYATCPDGPRFRKGRGKKRS